MEKVNLRASFIIKGKKHSEAGTEGFKNIEGFYNYLEGSKHKDYDYFELQIGSIFNDLDSKYKVVDVQTLFEPFSAFPDGTKQPFFDLKYVVEKL